jgi:glycosyltransferase involved in cell wall biosynthesis
MDHLKGGHVLLDALPTVAERLGRNVTLTLAGDGPMRRSWQHQAELIVRKDPRIQIIFPGWVGEEARVALFHKHDLLIMPSLWPEPFGQVGIEAGHFGLPSVAFARGGTSDWLIDGKNGYRALGTPSMALGLADTILRCLQDEGHYSELTEGARKVSLEFDVRTHMRSLLGLLERVGQESAA